MYIYVCLYMYVCINMYTHTYVHTHTQTHSIGQTLCPYGKPQMNFLTNSGYLNHFLYT